MYVPITLSLRHSCSYPLFFELSLVVSSCAAAHEPGGVVGQEGLLLFNFFITSGWSILRAAAVRWVENRSEVVGRRVRIKGVIGAGVSGSKGERPGTVNVQRVAAAVSRK